MNAPSGNSPEYQNVEVGDELFKLVTFYSQNLAVPKRRNPDDPDVLKGKALFYETGCVKCHQPKFVTGEAKGQPHLSNQLIYPYTDMLLHDMGPAASDGLREHDAGGSDWKTAPLMGLRLLRNYLHDGRARTVEEAIAMHGAEGSEAAASVALYVELPDEDRAALLRFVSAL